MGRVSELAVVSCSRSPALSSGNAIDINAQQPAGRFQCSADLWFRKRRAPVFLAAVTDAVGPEPQQSVW